MNILWITLESILPANSGGRLGVFKRLEQVARTENIFLFYPYDSVSEEQEIEELKKYCKEVHAYRRGDNNKSALKEIAKYPFTVSSRHIRAMQQDIQKCLDTKHIDVINVDFPHMCVDLLGIKTSVPIVLNEHNIEWNVYRMISSSQKHPLKKLLYWIDSYRLKKYEKYIFSQLPLKMVTFVSDKDMDYMVKEGPITKEKAVLIPVGADQRTELLEKKHDGHNIMFVGKMSYGPNIEAAEWFADAVFPKILKKVPDAKFYIVGKDPDEAVKGLERENIVVTGMVDSVEPYYASSDLVVLPLKNGGGVKVKLLEAVSYKKYIVSTSVGVEGTLYADGKTIPVSNKDNEFAEMCLSALFRNEEAYQRMNSAYDIFIENYTWESIGRKYVQTLTQICE